MKKLLICALFLISVTAFAREIRGPVYIIHADVGLFRMINESEGMLILDNLSQTVPFVNNQKTFKIGARRLTEFMNIWAAGGKLHYNDDPPDAQLLYYNQIKAAYVELLVELVEISFSENMSSITFKVNFFQQASSIPNELGEVTLFVDCFPFCI